MRGLLLLLTLALSPALSGAARAAETVYWRQDALLSDMFPGADRIEPLVFTPTPAQAAAAAAALGAPLPRSSYTFFVAWKGETRLGMTLIDEQVGQHEPITFAVQLDDQGRALRHEILVYREAYGGEVRDPRFRGQFVGKTAADPLRAGKDIRIVSGATYSSRAMAMGVKRSLVLAKLLLESEQR